MIVSPSRLVLGAGGERRRGRGAGARPRGGFRPGRGSPVTLAVRRAVPEDGPRILELDRELARFEKLTPPDDAEGRRLLAWIFE